MNSYLFGTGVPRFIPAGPEVEQIDIENSFIENIKLIPVTITHTSVINSTNSWINIKDNSHLEITIIMRLHKRTTTALAEFKNNYYFYDKTEVRALSPSQNADAFVDEDGQPVAFRLSITEVFPLSSPWDLDTIRFVFTSKKPVDLSGLNITAAGHVTTITDTDGGTITDTDGGLIDDL